MASQFKIMINNRDKPLTEECNSKTDILLILARQQCISQTSQSSINSTAVQFINLNQETNESMLIYY